MYQKIKGTWEGTLTPGTRDLKRKCNLFHRNQEYELTHLPRKVRSCEGKTKDPTRGEVVNKPYSVVCPKVFLDYSVSCQQVSTKNRPLSSLFLYRRPVKLVR